MTYEIIDKETLEKMSPEEIQVIINTAVGASQTVLAKKIKVLEQDQLKLKKDQILLEQDVKATQDSIDKVIGKLNTVDERTNNLRQAENSHLKKLFVKKVKNRCRLFIGKNDDSRYILFSHHIFRYCYGSIAYQLNIGSWENISAKDADKPDSQFQKACDLVDRWIPSREEIHRWINQLISKRDNGYLPMYRCKALTDYLNTHNLVDGTPLLP